MKKLIAAGALALGMTAGAAQAAPVITFAAGGSGTPANQSAVQTFDQYAAGTSLGTGATVYSTSVTGVSQRPTGATGNYLTVTSNGRYDFNFGAAGTGLFSFVLGSLDSYNQLIVHYLGAPDQTLNGTAIIGGLGAVGADGLATYNANGGPAFTGVSFLSPGQNSFEIDTISASVPEPAAWGMMILGFGLVGAALRRRANVSVRFA